MKEKINHHKKQKGDYMKKENSEEKKEVKKHEEYEQFPKGKFNKPFAILHHREKNIKNIK